MTQPRAPALDHWGDYDRDCPFPLFAEVRAAGPVHEVTLADGHRAFLVVEYAAAREALNHPDLSKDMHAALARDRAVVAEGLPDGLVLRGLSELPVVLSGPDRQEKSS
jgi:cytochrome P450